jgi:hypothetical protein
MLIEDFNAKMLLLGFPPDKVKTTNAGSTQYIWYLDKAFSIYLYDNCEYGSSYAMRSRYKMYERRSVQITFIFDLVLQYLENKDNPPQRLKKQKRQIK